ncbi:UNVERIFIED_CONTAM: Copia protein, partial [Sesamum radiatum]
WSHVSLLSSRNLAFARLLAQLIRLQAHFPDYSIKKIRLDNAGEFTSQTFNDYCMSIGIDVEHPVAYVHTQNGLAESFIKSLQLIARPLLMRSKLFISCWGHAILHAAALIRMRPTSYHKFSPLQLVFGQEPNISHLRVFGCAVYVPIAPAQRTKMGPQRKLGIYVGYESPSIVKYLEPLTGDLFTAHFADCHFDESVYPTLGRETKQLEQKINWNELSLSHLDPRTNQTANAPIKIDIHVGQAKIANEPKTCLKRGRPIGSKDKNPRKRKGAIDQDGQIEDTTLEESPGINNVLVPKELRQRNDWPKWKDAIEAELNSLAQRKVFGPVVRTPENVKPVGYKWIFVRNRNEQDEIVRYKARLVAQGFSQRPGIDYEQTYSPVVDATTFRYLISLAVKEGLDLRLLDVVTAYLYGSLDNDIYMKLPE